jgi:hypothetical protein
MRPTVRLAALAAGVAALAPPGPGVATAADGPEPPPDPSDAPGGIAGVNRARQAGIAISDATAKALAQAPAGTCMNEPSLPQCPRVRSVVALPGVTDPDAPPPPAVISGFAGGVGVGYGPAPSRAGADPTAHAARPTDARLARIAQADGYACHLKSLTNEIINLDGNYMARGTGENKCDPPVSYMETYVILKRYEERWWNLDTASLRNNGPGDLVLTARYDCDHDRTLAYDTETQGYAVLKGTGYFGADHLYNNHTCPA